MPRWPPELRRVSVPAGVSGPWCVEQRDGHTQLCFGEHVVMSDEPFELETHRQPVLEAKRLSPHTSLGGIDVLINGLGLGMIVQAMLSIRGVRVTVIEKSADVIKLVAAHYDRLQLTVIHADAYEWEPPSDRRYAVVWHDVWPSIRSDNLVGMLELERKYRGRCSWQESWGRSICLERLSRQHKSLAAPRLPLQAAP